MSLKRVISIERPAATHHWVGDGFPMRTMFDYNGKGKVLNPFIALDYGWPYKFEPRARAQGVGEHPHRGFETVTFAYKGEISHKDSTGSGGTITTGGVQWMTAAAGILHEESHSDKFAAEGGELEVIQLWVNLPAKFKKVAPKYQGFTKEEIPVVNLPNDGGFVRIIAGNYGGEKGAAQTYSPIDVLDAEIKKGQTAKFPLTKGWVSGVQIRYGELKVSGKVLKKGEFVMFSAEEPTLEIEALEDAGFLLLAGEPIREPIVGYGPFVMNTQQEIIEAFVDFENGKFGKPQSV